MKKTGFAFTLFTVCFAAAAVTLAFLNYVGRTARLRVAQQYTSPDYIRYLSQGYELDTVSKKKSILITVTDSENLPVRIHLFTIDEDKNTLDILDLPPDSFVIVDGFSGTLREAFSTPVYREMISMMLCMRIDGSASFDAKTLGDGAQMLGVTIGNGVEVTSELGERIALDGLAYSAEDVDSVKLYCALLAEILTNLSERGSLDSFTVLMNLIVNRVSTDMTIEDIIAVANSANGIKPKKINIRIAKGSPAKFGDNRIWSLDADGVAETLNQHFRVKDIEFPADSLSIPKVTAGEFPYSSLPEKVSDITK